jgi:hypothetical protein
MPNTNSTSPGEIQDPDGKVIWGGNIYFSGPIFMGDLPDSDPAVLGQLYNDSGVVTVSTGP